MFALGVFVGAIAGVALVGLIFLIGYSESGEIVVDPGLPPTKPHNYLSGDLVRLDIPLVKGMAPLVPAKKKRKRVRK